MATVEQYQARNTEITRLIADLNASKSKHEQSIAYNSRKANEWYADMKTCSFLSSKKNRECNSANDVRKAKGNAYRDQAIASMNTLDNITEVQIPALQAEFDQNIILIADAQQTSRDVSINLSNQGLTYEGATNRSTLEGEGMRQSEIDQGKAKAEAIINESEVDSLNKKNIGYVVAAAGLMAVILISFVLYRKIKK